MSSTDQLAQSIIDIVSAPRTILFAGAGIGARVGLPDWSEYIEQLARVSELSGDKDSALLIRKRVAKRQWLGAASVYKTAEIPRRGAIKRDGSTIFEENRSR
jgi:hypothetical protein